MNLCRYNYLLALITLTILVISLSGCQERPPGSRPLLMPTPSSTPPPGDLTITAVSGAMNHGNTIILTGSGYGSKDPVPPLLWDDCENKQVDSDAAVAAVYSYYRPGTESGSTPGAMQARMRYRLLPHEGTGPPHPYSTKALAGCHYTYPNNNPPYRGSGAEYFRDVEITIDSGIANKNKWFMTFYYRHNPSFWLGDHPGYYPNIKYFVVNKGPCAYDSAGFAYDVYRGGNANPNEAGPGATTSINNRHGSGTCNCGVYPTNFPRVNNPMYQWVKMRFELQSDATTGFRNTYIDKVLAGHYLSNCPNWFNNSQSITAGGYYQVNLINNITDVPSSRGNSGGTEADPINLAYRYFDDIYVDTTFSRVVLADKKNYASATVIEPQIPSAWSDTSITCTVNLGKLASGKAWLFVFDADNNHGEGFPVTIP